MTLARRLAVLTKHYPRRPARPPALDLSALTMEERFELEAILAILDGVPNLPNGRPDLLPLSDAQLERLDDLGQRISVKETP